MSNQLHNHAGPRPAHAPGSAAKRGAVDRAAGFGPRTLQGFQRG